jgi:hypothetical protein
MTDSHEYLVCEICYSAIGRCEPAELRQPLTGAMFTSVRPRREVPPPFAPSLDWEHMRCPMCNHRPFLRRDRVMTAHPSCFETPGMGPYYLLAEEPPAETAKTAKSTAQPEDAAQVAAQPVDAAQASTSQASMAAPDSETDNGPVTCPVCGKQYTSAASLARYHTPCPQATAADEGNL